jgi:ribosomal protein S27AE
MSEYTPPPAAWRLKVFLDAPVDELKRRQVDCPTCPVSLMCEVGEGGTGWTCGRCKSTGFEITPIESGKHPDEILMIDCAAHKFATKKESERMTLCALCSGNVMELEVVMGETKRLHYLTTVHAMVPVEERQRFLKEKFEFWKDEYAKKKKTEE